MKRIKYLLFLISEFSLKKILKPRSIFTTLAVMSLTFTAASLIPSLLEQILNNLFGLFIKQQNDCSYAGTFIFILLTFLFSYMSHKLSNVKENLIENIKIYEWLTVRNSKIHTFKGSILNIKDIDVVITSENTSLSLGSITGTSVSGRIRKLAASYNSDGTLNHDHLNDNINLWKQQQTHLGPYQLGIIIPSQPFNASHNGIKSIIHAIAIEKTNSGENLIDQSKVRKILIDSIGYCKSQGFSSIFIPIFGLGSGQIARDKAIEATLSTLIDVLKHEPYSLNVYIGIYRTTDEIMVGHFLLGQN